MKTLYILMLCCFGLSAQVADSYYLPTNLSYKKDIPTPSQYLGYQVGEQHISPLELISYIKEIDRLSDRMTTTEYAKSFEKRSCLFVTVTSPQNHGQIEKIKADHLKLINPKEAQNTSNMPIVVWMGYSVHGNEPSGTNAAAMVAYYLAAAEGPSIDSLLNETVILMDPVINPDGGNRFATWVNQNKGSVPNADPNTRELIEPYPGGRTNHYWFDLNRDWLHQQMPESRGRLAKFYEWRPNILTDHHEMGSNSSFFFQPGVPKRTHPMTPQKNIELTTKIGKFHAKFLDGIGSLYYTQENYDDFYYGKGSTLPDANGSVGILFEQASSRGHLRDTPNGVLSFPFTIKNQFTATLSTLAAAKSMRVEMLDYMRAFYRENSPEPAKSYVFGGSNDKVRTAEMVNILKRNQIEVYRLSSGISLDGGHTATADNGFVVPLNQPQHRLIQALFEKRTSFADSLFYDISSFNIGFSMGVQFAEKSGIALSAKVNEPLEVRGQVFGSSKLAYVFEWDSYLAPKTAYELQKAGFRLRVATEPFSAQVNGSIRNFSFGTVMVLCQDKKPEALLKTLAEADGVDFYGVETGLTSEGIDLGSEKFKNMKLPKIAVASGFGASYNEAGEVWHLLDTRMKVPCSMVDIETLNRTDLSKYTHLVLAGGSYGSLSDTKIKSFVQSGGVLVTLTDASRWAIDKGLLNAKLRQRAESKERRPYASAGNDAGALETAGTIFEIKADLTNPLFYGYKNSSIPVFKDNSLAMDEVPGVYENPAVFGEKPLLAGYVHPSVEKTIRKAAAYITQNLGQGRIIATTENPNFRAYWYGTNKIFMNSLFFGHLVGTPSRFEE